MSFISFSVCFLVSMNLMGSSFIKTRLFTFLKFKLKRWPINERVSESNDFPKNEFSTSLTIGGTTEVESPLLSFRWNFFSSSLLVHFLLTAFFEDEN